MQDEEWADAGIALHSLAFFNLVVRHIDENRMSAFQCNSSFIAKNSILVNYTNHSFKSLNEILFTIVSQIKAIKLVVGLAYH